MRKGQASGYLFSLDDFDSGLSSFAYLKTLPVNFLKIDAGFIKNMQHDPIDPAIAEAIHRIGPLMSLKRSMRSGRSAWITTKAW